MRWRCAALPPDAGPRTAKNAAGEEVEVKADPAGPLVAQVFKTRIDPFVQKLSFLRDLLRHAEEGRHRAGRRHAQGR